MSLRMKLLLSSFSSFVAIASPAASANYGAQDLGVSLPELNTTAVALRNHSNGNIMQDALHSRAYEEVHAVSPSPARFFALDSIHVA